VVYPPAGSMTYRREIDEHPAFTPLRSMAPLTLHLVWHPLLYTLHIVLYDTLSSLWLPYGIGQTIIFSCCGLFMVALWNRETIYIFMLWFVLSSSFFFFFFFPRLISAAADWMSAILPHMVWP